MFSIGVVKPEISTNGTAAVNTPRIACCCVRQIEETISPTPTIDRMNSIRLPKSQNIEPVNGIRNTNTPAEIRSSLRERISER